MIALSGGANPIAISDFKKDVDKALMIRGLIDNKITTLCNSHLDFLIQHIDWVMDEINSPPNDLLSRLTNLRTNLGNIRDNLVTGTAAQNVSRIITANTQLSNLLSNGGLLRTIQNQTDGLISNVGDGLQHTKDIHITAIQSLLEATVDELTDPDNFNDRGIKQLLDNLETVLDAIKDFSENQIGGDTLPNEPYTPTIKSICLDYCAKSEKDDIQLIHLYPFENTHKLESIETTPTLLPSYTDEGTLFIGLEKAVPGATLNLLFQLAEATANSEAEGLDEKIKWHYLHNNSWDNPLRPGFEIIEDNTLDFRQSGIVKIALPEDLSDTGYTIMPEGKFWLKASMTKNIETICETIAIHTQAVKATYAAGAENQRTTMQLEAGALSKLAVADANLKKVNQFYESFGGKVAEPSDTFYQRVSERLRHKGRAINIFDYERLVLQHFTNIRKARCVSHTLGLAGETYVRDLEFAPGFVTVAVIPDLKVLKSGNVLEPRAPLSLLEAIKAMLQTKNTPFARLKVMNPRYEKIHVRVSINLKKGKSNKAFYTKQLEKDITGFLAPWMTGTGEEALCFGRKISRSDLIYFIECLDYVDYICYLDPGHEEDFKCRGDQGQYETGAAVVNSQIKSSEVIYPLSARSILTAGPIEVCVTDDQCEKFMPPPDSQTMCENVVPMTKRETTITDDYISPVN